MSKRKSPVSRMTALDEAISGAIPQVASFYSDEEDFIALYIKHRDDGSCLAVAKRYDGEGLPVVCFGNGYGLVGSLLALDGSMASNAWRPDKPWSGGK